MPPYPGRCCKCGCVVASGGLGGTTGSPISTARWKDFNDNIVKDGTGRAKRPAGDGVAKFRNRNRLCWTSGGILSLATGVTVSAPGWVRFYAGMSADGASWLAVEQRYYQTGYTGAVLCPMLRFLSNSATIHETNYLGFDGKVVGAYYDKATEKLYALRRNTVFGGGGALTRIECPVGVGAGYGAYAGFGADEDCGLVVWTGPIVSMAGDSVDGTGAVTDCNYELDLGGYYDLASPCLAHTLTGDSYLSEYELDWWYASGPVPGNGWTFSPTSATWARPATSPHTGGATRTIIIDDCDNEVIVTLEAAVNPGYPSTSHGIRGTIHDSFTTYDTDFAEQGATKTVSASNLPLGTAFVFVNVGFVSFQPSVPSATAVLSGHGWHAAEPC